LPLSVKNRNRVSSMNRFRIPELNKLFQYFKTIQFVGLVTTAVCFVLFEMTLFVLLPAIYSQHPAFSGFRVVFWICFLLTQAPFLILLARNFRDIFPTSFQRFLFRFEQANHHCLSNQASALLKYEEEKVLPEQDYFLNRARQELSDGFSSARLEPLLPHPMFRILAILVLVYVPIELTVDSQRNQIAMQDLLYGANQRIQVQWVDLKPAYLINRPIRLQGKVLGEPLFPLQAEIADENAVLTQSYLIQSFQQTSKSQFSFNLELPGLKENSQIRIRTGDFTSDWTALTLVEYPKLQQFSFTISPPEYTENQNPSQYQRLPLSILKGSYVKQKLQFNKPVSELKIRSTSMSTSFSGWSVSRVGESEFEIGGTLHGDGSMRFHFTDPHGFSDQSSSFRYRVREDKEPVLQILKPAIQQKVKKGMLAEIPVDLKAQDDTAITQIELEIRSRQRFEMTYIGQKETHILTETNSRVALVQTTVEMESTLYLSKGDRVSLNFLVQDEFPSRGKIKSETYVLYVPYFFEEHAQAERDTQELVGDMEKVKTEQENQEQSLQDLAKKVKGKRGQLDGATQQKLKEMARQKQELQKQAKDIEAKLDEMMKKERENQLLDEGTLRKMNQIRELFQEIMKDMQAQMMSLQSMANQAPKLNNQQLDQMMQNFSKDKFSEEIDRTLKSLKKVKAKRKFQKNMKRMEKILKDHQELAKQFSQEKSAPPTSLQELQKEWEQTKKELEELSKDSNLDPSLREAITQELEKRSQNIEQAYKEMSQANQKGQHQKAANKNLEVQKQMMEMKQNLQKEDKKSQQQVMRIDLEKLNGFLAQTHHQAGFVLQVKKRLSHLSGLTRKRYAARQFSFLDSSSRTLYGQMKAEYEENLNFQKVVLRVLELLQERIADTVEFFSADRPTTKSQPIDQVFRLNNQLTAILLSLKEELEKQQNSQDLSQYLESLEQLTQQQNQINQQTQQMSQQSMMNQQMMQQMAFQQELVRRSTEELYEQYKEKMDLAGKLKGLGKEMQEVKGRLEKGDLSEDTRKKQKQIEYKLLEAHSAMKEQKEGKKRKSEQASEQNQLQKGATGRVIQGELEEQSRQLMKRRDIPLKMKELIRKYFDRLEKKQ